MKKEIKIVVPNDWSAVSLEQYLALRKDMEIYKDVKSKSITHSYSPGVGSFK